MERLIIHTGFPYTDSHYKADPLSVTPPHCLLAGYYKMISVNVYWWVLTLTLTQLLRKVMDLYFLRNVNAYNTNVMFL